MTSPSRSKQTYNNQWLEKKYRKQIKNKERKVVGYEESVRKKEGWWEIKTSPSCPVLKTNHLEGVHIKT